MERSAQYQQIATEVTTGAASDEELALKVFDWTRRNIRETPEGWPVVDDHILNIIIRGHGVSDQQADVFTTLTAYAGVPAFRTKVRLMRDGPGVLLSFVDVGGRWCVFDVVNGIVFRTTAGQMATLEELAGHPELVPDAVRTIDLGGISYAEVVTRATTPPAPSPTRVELQMPTRRAWHEMLVVLRLRKTVNEPQ